jgi:hypothetical protein
MHPTRHQRFFAVAILLALAAVVVAAGVAFFLAEGAHLAGALGGTLFALIIVVALLRTDTELLIRALRGLQVLGPIVAFSLISLLMGKTSGSLHFDEVGAQILIVLLLALAVDARFFRLRAGRDRLDVAAILFTMSLLAVGEYYSLNALLTDHPAHAEMIAGAIAAGFAAVAITALTGAGRVQGAME